MWRNDQKLVQTLTEDSQEKTAIARQGAVLDHLAQTNQFHSVLNTHDAVDEMAKKQSRIRRKREKRRARMVKLFGAERAQRIRDGHRRIRQKLRL